MPRKTVRCKCGGPLMIIDTTKPPKYQALVIVQRRRKCTVCDNRLTTYEVSREDWQWILDKEKELNERDEAHAWMANEVETLRSIRHIVNR